MKDYLPTLKGLQAFEAVYEFNSFTDAAKALNVQQPAISYQIKTLENELGVRLFARQHGRLVATPQAELLFETVSRAFDSVRRTTQRIREADKRPAMTIATYPGIATHWLTPRIGRLSDQLGRMTRIITLIRDADLFREKTDCWIVFGRGVWPGFEARLLLQEEVCPVAAPSVAERIAAAAGGTLPEGIAIIEQEDPEHRWLSWDDWQDRSRDPRSLDGPRIAVNDHGLALHMALTGAGITLGWTAVIRDLLDGGTLVRVSPDSVVSDAGYWLVGRPGFFETRIGMATLATLAGS